MTTALTLGLIFGAVIGLLHAGQVYLARRALDHSRPSRASAFYYALWTFFLWALLGSYVLILWLFSVVLYVPCRGVAKLRS